MRRRDGLIGFHEVARRLGKSVGYTYTLSSTDPAFPPVEKQEGARKYFAVHTVNHYRRVVRKGRWRRSTRRA